MNEDLLERIQYLNKRLDELQDNYNKKRKEILKEMSDLRAEEAYLSL